MQSAEYNIHHDLPHQQAIEKRKNKKRQLKRRDNEGQVIVVGLRPNGKKICKFIPSKRHRHLHNKKHWVNKTTKAKSTNKEHRPIQRKDYHNSTKASNSTKSSIRSRRRQVKLYKKIRLLFMSILCAQSVSAMNKRPPSRELDDVVNDLTEGVGGISTPIGDKQSDDNDMGSLGIDIGAGKNGSDWETKVDDMFKGWGNKEVINAMKALLPSSELSGGSDIKMSVKDYLVGLLDSNDAETLKTTFEKRQSELGDKIDELPLGDEVIKSRTENDEHKEGKDGNKETWQSNFGEGLNKKTEGVAYANYAPTSDSKLQDEKHCRIPRINPCMQKFSKVRTLPCVVCCFLVLFYILTNLYTYLSIY